MLQVTINENKCVQELRQDILQHNALYLCVKWPYFLLISAGQDSNIVVILLKSLINPWKEF